MSPGIYPGLSNADYHAGPGLSNSQIKRLLRTPFHMHALLTPSAPEKAPTPQQLNGTLVHCALLEPDKFDSRYLVEDINRRTKAGRERAQELADEGFEVIDLIQRDAAFAQAAALRALPEVAELLASGQPEVSAYWQEAVALDTGHHELVLCKCRPDWVHYCGTPEVPAAILVDVKTTESAEIKDFRRSVANYAYHQQCAWYCRGFARAAAVEVAGMLFATVESSFPFAARAFMLSDRAIEIGRRRNERALKIYAQCQRSGIWPSYPAGIEVIDLPAWAED